MTDISSSLDTQALPQLQPLDILPDFTPLHSTHNGFTVLLKLRTSDISYTTELFTDWEVLLIKLLLEQLTVSRTLIHWFHGTESDTSEKRKITVMESIMNGHSALTPNISSITQYQQLS